MNEISILRRVYNFITRHWILSTFILLSPSLMVLYFVNAFFNGEVALDKLKTIFFLLNYFVLTIGVFTLMKQYADKYNNMVKDNGLLVYSVILQSMDLGKRRKLNRFYKFIEEHQNNFGINPFNEITQPQKQIKVILDNIQFTLCKLFGLNPNEIGLSVIYKTDKQSEWKWVANLNIENDLPLNKMIKEPTSTAFQIINNGNSFVFYPDKRTGLKEKKFYAGPVDEQKQNIGSIICKDISLDHNNNLLKAVLSITTYGKQLCDEYDADSINKIKELLIPSFEYRIKVELALLYIKDHIATIA
ncbi:MAG: hypothetical protein V1773_04920 [bacterium]